MWALGGISAFVTLAVVANEAQRAMVGDRIANMRQGTNRYTNVLTHRIAPASSGSRRATFSRSAVFVRP